VTDRPNADRHVRRSFAADHVMIAFSVVKLTAAPHTMTSL
jgi:hypothetical protein